MLAVYLACLVAGAFVIVLSLFGGGDTDLDIEASGDIDVEAGELDAEPGGEGTVALARFLSARNALFFAGFFGMGGALLTMLGAEPTATLVASIALGLTAALAIHHAMGYLRRSQSGAVPGPAALAGARARVVVGPTRATPGKVVVSVGDRTHQLVARIHDGCDVDHFETGDLVVIVRVQDGTALVAERSFLA